MQQLAWRRTVKTTISLQGVGLHSGRPVRLAIHPATEGGIRFRRLDRPASVAEIAASADAVVDTRLCTKIANAHGTEIGTVEHLMAALAGTGVTDALIELDGPEIPIMDGSSAPFLRGLHSAGTVPLSEPSLAIRLLAPVEVRSGDKLARLVPAERFTIAFTIEFDEAAIGRQSLELDMAGPTFSRALADCRTFCRNAEVELLRAAGLGLGGSLENAIVVDGGQVLNPGGLRRADEFVRHKMLDAVGDLALAGAPIIGRYEGVKAGHEMNNRLLRALFATPEAWCWAEAAASAVPGPVAEPASLAV